jgi:Starch-binding associating with outer membrane
MKKKIIYLAVLLTLGSCNKWISDDFNTDPNNPSDVGMANLLPSVQYAWAYVQGGDIGRYNGVFTQHFAGVDRQHAGLDIYTFTESDVSNSYETVYTEALQDLDVIKKKATGTSPYYLGISQTMTAMILMQMTDLYGDLPFSQAFQGADNLNPAYDSQESLYNSIFAMLDAAQVNFATSEDDNSFIPASDDLLYGGDMSLWMALSNSLEARGHLHLGKRDAAHYGMALAAIDAGAIVDNGGNAVIHFGSGATSQNPYAQFMEQRGDIACGKFFIDTLVALNDPRIGLFAYDDESDEDENTVTYSGSAPGEFSFTVSFPGPYLFYTDYTSYVPFVMASEVKFIEAEAAYQAGDLARAAAAHNAAVGLSLEQFGASDDAYIAANGNKTEADITMGDIMLQKYVALYTHPETYNDIRRTGMPALTPAPGATTLPLRWPYAQNERITNSSFPGAVSIFEPVWWDVD